MNARRAFSLVELLVVLAILTVFIALLLPAIVRARKQATRVVCMSNLRQVAQALLAYAEAGRGSFPAAAFAEIAYPEDWIHWQPLREVARNGIMPYLDGNVEILKCPMGVPERARAIPPTGGGPRSYPSYPFSYSVNGRFTGYSTGFQFDPRVNGQGFARLGKIFNPSEKAMMIEEDATGIDDGVFWPAGGANLTGRQSSVSLRHDKEAEYWGDPKVSGAYFGSFHDGRGNVAFADGHCEFFRRGWLQAERYNDPNYRGP